jgi:hypothetical protein
VESQLSQEFSLLHVAETGSGAHPASYTIGNGALSPGLKRPVSEAGFSPISRAKVKETWVYTSTLPYVLMT